MDNWVPAHIAADGAHGPYTMGYFTRDDIPFQFALADAFTILDSYHCSVLGPTGRTGHVDERDGRPERAGRRSVADDRWPGRPVQLEDLPERLRGRRQLEDLPGAWVAGFNAVISSSRSTAPRPGDPLFDKGMNAAVGPSRTTAQRQPADGQLDPAAGRFRRAPGRCRPRAPTFVAGKIDAVAANPEVWAKTVFILSYDENDGMFDHVLRRPRRGHARRVRVRDLEDRPPATACRSASVSGCRASSSRRGPSAARCTPRCPTTRRSSGSWSA